MEEIINELKSNNNVYQEEAVKKALNNKGKINDYLLKELEDLINSDLSYINDDNFPVMLNYAVFILVEFKDKRLFPLLIKLFKKTEIDMEELLGDLILDQIDYIIYEVYNGDIDSINELIFDNSINSYIRGNLVDSYVLLNKNDYLNKEDIEKYLLKLINILNNKDLEYMYFIYNEIVDVWFKLKLSNLNQEIKKIFDNELVDFIPNYNEHIKDFDKEVEITTGVNIECLKSSAYFCDTSEFKFNYEKQETIRVNKIGRNEPCPCGSGLKYKKCCGK